MAVEFKPLATAVPQGAREVLCDLCQEPLAANALACASCGEKTAAGRKASVRGFWIGVGIAVSSVTVSFVLLREVARLLPGKTQAAQRIDENCERLFPHGGREQSACKLSLPAKEEDARQDVQTPDGEAAPN